MAQSLLLVSQSDSPSLITSSNKRPRWWWSNCSAQYFVTGFHYPPDDNMVATSIFYIFCTCAAILFERNNTVAGSVTQGLKTCWWPSGNHCSWVGEWLVAVASVKRENLPVIAVVTCRLHGRCHLVCKHLQTNCKAEEKLWKVRHKLETEDIRLHSKSCPFWIPLHVPISPGNSQQPHGNWLENLYFFS